MIQEKIPFERFSHSIAALFSIPHRSPAPRRGKDEGGGFNSLDYLSVLNIK